MVDRFCRGCQYLGHITSGYCCEYLAVTGRVRGCPSGQGCTRYVAGGRKPSIAAIETVRERAAKNCAEKCRGRQQRALREYLDKRDITMKALSQEIGVSPGTVHRWIREMCLADWDKLATVGIAKPEGL